MSEREFLEKLVRVLEPLDTKIEHSLWDGTPGQMRADLTYLRALLSAALAAIREQLVA